MFIIRVVSRLLQKVYYQKLKLKGVEIGQHTYISRKAYIDAHKPAKVKIGNNCYITRNVVILNHTDTKRGGPLGIWEQIGGRRIYGNVIIGDNVFIGVNSVIMPGVTIGNNVIIGALSLVNKDIPDDTIFGGIPAKELGKTFEYVGK